MKLGLCHQRTEKNNLDIYMYIHLNIKHIYIVMLWKKKKRDNMESENIQETQSLCGAKDSSLQNGRPY